LLWVRLHVYDFVYDFMYGGFDYISDTNSCLSTHFNKTNRKLNCEVNRIRNRTPLRQIFKKVKYNIALVKTRTE
jgi:hypothetical protein